jgi:hypothetical protein
MYTKFFNYRTLLVAMISIILETKKVMMTENARVQKSFPEPSSPNMRRRFQDDVAACLPLMFLLKRIRCTFVGRVSGIYRVWLG